MRQHNKDTKRSIAQQTTDQERREQFIREYKAAMAGDGEMPEWPGEDSELQEMLVEIWAFAAGF